MNAQKRRIRFKGLPYPGNSVESDRQVELVILPQSAAPELHDGVPESPRVNRRRKTACSGRQVDNAGSFRQMGIRVVQQIVRTSEFGNHFAKALGGASVLQNPGNFLLP